jgi:hypothetical protein
MRRLLIALGLVAALSCDDRGYREIGASIDVLTKRTDGLPGPAIDRLRRIGRRALPQVETAMHTAAPNGKLQLVAALDAIAEPEGALILRHFAAYDANASVRAACDEVLERWARSGDRRADPARQALAFVDGKRRAGLAE